MESGRLGVWCVTDRLASAELAAFAGRVESWGYGAPWQPEMLGRDVLTATSWLLANTTRLTVASGIASIYGHDAQPALSAQQGLAEQAPDWAGAGSDRLIDAMIAWGGEDTIRGRLQQHWDAGIDHVCIQPLSDQGSGTFAAAVLQRLAPAAAMARA